MKRLAAKLSIALLATLLTLEVCLQLASLLDRSDGAPVSGPDDHEIEIWYE